MPRYRKKPVVIEAMKVDEVLKFAQDAGRSLPQWIHDAYASGTIIFGQSCIFIVTLEGRMIAAPGDWMIQGIAGEIYPCKPDIFEKTYELVTR